MYKLYRLEGLTKKNEKWVGWTGSEEAPLEFFEVGELTVGIPFVAGQNSRPFITTTVKGIQEQPDGTYFRTKNTLYKLVKEEVRAAMEAEND